MNSKNHIAAWLGSGLLIFAISSAASDDFKQWMQQQSAGVQTQKTEFQEYKDKRDKDFTAFLKAQWKAVDVVKGDVRDEEPKPDVMPVAPPISPPILPPGPVSTIPAQAPVAILVPEPSREPLPAVAPEQPPVVVAEGEPLGIDFYGKQIYAHFEHKFIIY